MTQPQTTTPNLTNLAESFSRLSLGPPNPSGLNTSTLLFYTLLSRYPILRTLACNLTSASLINLALASKTTYNFLVPSRPFFNMLNELCLPVIVDWWTWKNELVVPAYQIPWDWYGGEYWDEYGSDYSEAYDSDEWMEDGGGFDFSSMW